MEVEGWKYKIYSREGNEYVVCFVVDVIGEEDYCEDEKEDCKYSAIEEEILGFVLDYFDELFCSLIKAIN